MTETIKTIAENPIAAGVYGLFIIILANIVSQGHYRVHDLPNLRSRIQIVEQERETGGNNNPKIETL